MALALAFLVNFALEFLLGCAVFWTTEVGGLANLADAVFAFFSGSIVPLWLFPDWLARVAAALPMRATAHVPNAIFIGRLQWPDVALAILGQCA